MSPPINHLLNYIFCSVGKFSKHKWSLAFAYKMAFLTKFIRFFQENQSTCLMGQKLAGGALGKEPIQLPREIPWLHIVANLLGLLQQPDIGGSDRSVLGMQERSECREGWRSPHGHVPVGISKGCWQRKQRVTLKIQYSFRMALPSSLSIRIKLSTRSSWHIWTDLARQGAGSSDQWHVFTRKVVNLPCHYCGFVLKESSFHSFPEVLGERGLQS